MEMYYLVRNNQIINAAAADSLAKASYDFRHHKHNPAKVGDEIMCVVLKAEPLGDWEWKQV
jgi:ribosomal protein L14